MSRLLLVVAVRRNHENSPYEYIGRDVTTIGSIESRVSFRSQQPDANPHPQVRIQLGLRLAPSQLMESLFVNPEIVCYLMDHGDRHLLDHLFFVGAYVQQGVSINGDGVRE
jgi:hypothetical protein